MLGQKRRLDKDSEVKSKKNERVAKNDRLAIMGHPSASTMNFPGKEGSAARQRLAAAAARSAPPPLRFRAASARRCRRLALATGRWTPCAIHR